MWWLFLEFFNFDVGKNRIYNVDWLKTIAILAVLLLHCSSKYLMPDFVFQPNWYCGVFFESLSRFGVPLFIMVSGFLILRKDQPISSVPRRIKRVLIPFIFSKKILPNHSCLERKPFIYYFTSKSSSKLLLSQ